MSEYGWTWNNVKKSVQRYENDDIAWCEAETYHYCDYGYPMMVRISETRASGLLLSAPVIDGACVPESFDKLWDLYTKTPEYARGRLFEAEFWNDDITLVENGRPIIYPEWWDFTLNGVPASKTPG